MARVLVVGSSNTDLVVRASRIPSPGETVLGEDLFITPGGKGANQAVAAARLGAEVRMIARIGRDMFGDAALESLSDSGVSTDLIVRDSAAPSGVALISVDASGQNAIVVAPGSNARLSSQDISDRWEAFEWADVVVVQLEIPPETVVAAVHSALTAGKQIVLNPAPSPTYDLEPILPKVSLITPNEHESRALTGLSGVFDVRCELNALRDLGVGTAIITLGGEGAAGLDGENLCILPGIPVDVVDTTAAGDCFTGAIAVATAERMAFQDAMRFANAAAARSVMKTGAQASLPTRLEVAALLSSIAPSAAG